MHVRETARTYPENKISPNVRALEDVKKDMTWQEQSIRQLRENIADYDSGWADDFDDNPRKRANMERRLKTAEETYAKLKTEYESHPDYYADKYKDTSGFEKAVTETLGSTIATVPVIAETTAAAVKETRAKGRAEDYAAALQAEKIAKNKMNDYAASYVGFFDMIDQSELDRLCQEYEQASQRRKEIERQYEEPVDMDSWGMNLMEESAWLKNSATENLDGIWKAGADIAIDVGQGLALSPLLLGGAKTYIAGVAANAAAEDMFEQTAEGKSASKALGSGVLTAGAETAKGAIGNAKIPVSDILQKIGTEGSTAAKRALETAGIPATKEMIYYFIDFLEDKAKGNPDAKFSFAELLLHATKGGVEGLVKGKTDGLAEEIDKVWNTFG